MDEAEKTGVKKTYTWLEALSIIRQAILTGEVDKKGTGIFVCFEIEIDNKKLLYRFIAYRDDDGQLGIDVIKVSLDNKWDAGNGACFS